MRFDDRLATVLNQPVSDPHDVAVRWRQLVELVARAGASSGSPLTDRAIEIINADASQVEEGLRAAAARAVAALPLPFALLSHFASDKLSVSAPILAATSLDAPQWRALFEAADDETRRFIAALHPDIAGAETPGPELPATSGGSANVSSGPSLHALVERIERRRRTRAQQEEGAATPGGAPRLFRWECGPGGQISWVDGAPRGPLIGRSLARPQEGEGDRVDERVSRAFMLRAPFHEAALSIAGAGAVAGEWKISGVPAFDPGDGRFAGYRGVALREQQLGAEGEQDLLSDPNSVRELVHEIKTPLNAIIGFAEIIDAQLLGPAGEGYRERAADIVRQAQLLLSAINDLDLAAKLHAGPVVARRTDLGALLEALAPELRQAAADRGIEFDFFRAPGPMAGVEPVLAERLVRRVVAAALDAAAPGEVVGVSGRVAEGRCAIAVTRPDALRNRSEEEFFADGEWRLARGLAAISGASLALEPEAVAITFPVA